jgi:hypothetical protein
MRTTLPRPTEDAATPQELDRLERIDVGGENHHRTAQPTRWIIAAVVAVIAIAAAVFVTLALTGGESAVAPEAAIEAPLTLHEQGKDPGPTCRPGETDVIVLDHCGLDAVTPVAATPKVNAGELIAM